MKDFPEAIEFRPVRAQLKTYRQIYNLISMVTFATIFTVAALIFNAQADPDFWHGLSYIPAAWVLLYDLGVIILTPFQVRIHGWVEQSDDIIVRSGAIFRNYEAMPYGRLQFVHVKQGPLQRAFDLADLTITTAGATATIYGLPTREATRLRDDLCSRGYARLAGL